MMRVVSFRRAVFMVIATTIGVFIGEAISDRVWSEAVVQALFTALGAGLVFWTGKPLPDKARNR